MIELSSVTSRQMADFENWPKLTILKSQASPVVISKVRSDCASVFSVLSLPWR